MTKAYEVDLHGMQVYEAKVLLDSLLDQLPREYNELTVIHGYHTHVLRDYVRHRYHHDRVTGVRESLNPGQTVLELKRYKHAHR